MESTNPKKAFITGITGQDGSYLAEYLLAKGYKVHGLVRRSSSFNRWRLRDIYKDAQSAESKITLHYGDLSDASSLSRLLEKINPDEIYNLGAQSHVQVSFDTPEYTGDITGLGTTRILEAIRDTRIKTKFYQASSSELFGKAKEIPQCETTPFYPRSPYGAAKAYAYWITVNYRESYGLFASNGILFNHESPRRGESFVTKKIAKGVAEIKAGLRDTIHLGNLDARRDWGYAPEYVDAMWRMLQHSEPDDFVVATGETHSIREFLDEAFRVAEIGDWEKHVGIDKRYMRPAEVDVLMGDPSKAAEKLGWRAETRFPELVRIMVDHEIKQLSGA